MTNGADVDWNAEVLDQLETHWHGRLRPRLTGLTDEEFFWEPVPDCWTLRRRGSGFTLDLAERTSELEPVTTIAWRLAHLVVGFAETSGQHFGGPPADMATFSFAGTADAALHQLDETHDRWVEGVRGLGQTGLARAQGPTQPPEFAHAPMARLILYTNLEVIHHGAEICLLRDLYLRDASS